jgi:hypothetical protein
MKLQRKMVTSKWLTKTKPSREQYLSFSQEMSARSLHYLQLFFCPLVSVLYVYLLPIHMYNSATGNALLFTTGYEANGPLFISSVRVVPPLYSWL